MYREWIPVEKCLPDKEAIYLVTAHGAVFDAWFFTEPDRWEKTGSNDCVIYNVVAWMPEIPPYETPPFQCQPNCGHSDDEHKAFDDGFLHNRPPTDPKLKEIWEIGRSANLNTEEYVYDNC